MTGVAVAVDLEKNCPMCGHAECEGCCEVCSEPGCYRNAGCPECSQLPDAADIRLEANDALDAMDSVSREIL